MKMKAGRQAVNPKSPTLFSIFCSHPHPSFLVQVRCSKPLVLETGETCREEKHSCFSPSTKASENLEPKHTHTHRTPSTRCLQKMFRCSLLWSTPGVQITPPTTKAKNLSLGRSVETVNTEDQKERQGATLCMCNILNTHTAQRAKSWHSKRRRGRASRLNFSFPILSVSVEQLINKA